MRLLSLDSSGKLSLTADLPNSLIPPYAILSHTWGPDEVLLEDLESGTAQGKAGYRKIKFCAEQARCDGLGHFWVDTCCIDKKNSAELSEAINSMFRWYRSSAKCYVYLSDVSPSIATPPDLADPTGESEFRASRWFTRGWTLQELVAPPNVQFFASDGTALGDKESLQELLHDITGIPTLALRGAALDRFDVKERFGWAEGRETTREEDWAYCLLGIFNVFIPPIYGEGKASAVHRLAREINNPHPTTHSLPALIVPYTRNPGFVGRAHILEQLRSRLGHGQNQQSTVQSRVSLYGLGGVGKTQIALAYVYWLHDAYPDVSVFWVHASSTERFRQAYTSIARACQIPGHDNPKTDVLAAVKSWLEQKTIGRWLLVIDNADDTEVFFKRQPAAAAADSHSQREKASFYVPECAHGSVLFTTRNKQAGSRLARGNSLVEVEKMDEGESYELLQTAMENFSLDPRDMSKISARLEHLPLALIQAAAFIRENGISVDEYLRFLDKNDQNLVDLLTEEFETVGRDSETPKAITETWIVSFEQIQRQHTLASDLLSFMSLLDRQAIPRDFLTYYVENQRSPGSKEEMQLIKALGVLKAFSFITENKDGSLDIHRLVQLVTQKWLVRNSTMRHFGEQALMTVTHHYPFGKYENWTFCSQYLPHAQAVLNGEGGDSRAVRLTKASLLYHVAIFFFEQGLWKKAAEFQRQAAAMRTELLGLEDHSTLNSRGSLALIYWRQGRSTEAEELTAQVLEAKTRILGPEHPATLTDTGNLASIYQNQGRFTEAEKLMAQVLEAKTRILGPEHPHTLANIGDLASIYHDQGRFTEAEELTAQVFEAKTRILGPEHPATLVNMGILASVYHDQGRFREAEELLARVLEARTKVLGSEHPDTLSAMGNLASIYQDQGRFTEAEELAARVLEAREKVLEPEHPATLANMGNLASIYQDQGRFTEAEELLAQVLEARKRVLEPEHPHTLVNMGNLALIYQDQGRFTEAEELTAQVLEASTKVLGPEHPTTLVNMRNLARIYWDQGRLTEAEKLFARVLQARKRVLGPEHPRTMNSKIDLELLSQQQGRLLEAAGQEV